MPVFNNKLLDIKVNPRPRLSQKQAIEIKCTDTTLFTMAIVYPNLSIGSKKTKTNKWPSKYAHVIMDMSEKNYQPIDMKSRAEQKKVIMFLKLKG